MESSSSFCYLMFNILMLLSFSLVYPQKAFSYRCHDHERSALLQFKQTFTVDINHRIVGCDDLFYPKISTWNLEGDQNTTRGCCEWDGVDCDKDTGHVIGLDLSCSRLFGSISSSSSLFHLVHLRRLNLAYNHFNRSCVPTGFVHLSKLTYLNLSYSAFSGEVPLEISHLSMLSSLDLSASVHDLTLSDSTFKSLILNLTNIKELVLSNVDMSATVISEILPNLSSSLTMLNLAGCRLYGEFPGRVFSLPNIHYLDLSFNYNLRGYLPEFNLSNSLNHLKATLTGFSGKLPDSLGNLNQLIKLDLSRNNFSGHIPFSISNLSMLTTLNLEHNSLWGPIPNSFYQLKSLESLALSDNRLSDVVDLDMFLSLKNLSDLSLSANNLSVFSSSTSSISNKSNVIAQLSYLDLVYCKLTKLPEFLQNQSKLITLVLSENSIQGLLPRWIFNYTSVEYLHLSHNSLTGFDQFSFFNPHSIFEIISLDNNQLKGSLPIPSSIFAYDVSNNALEDEISASICNLTSIGQLYLSNNGFSGNLPPCLVNLSTSLSILKLEGNYFSGTIPDLGKDGCFLDVMVLSENLFEGELPRSLANCTKLEVLDVGNNQIKDTFPFWLGSLPLLKVLVLRFNKFNGAIRDPDHQNKTTIFPLLHIVDISHNSFSGNLPNSYFQKWDAMKVFEAHSNYMYIPITITNKGSAREYYLIQNLLNLLDFSSNRFEGEIPESIGNLKGLHSFNLSNNFLTGNIPPSLRNLSNLEVLDISHNKLSGEIPQQLTQLNFLGSFNVAYNNLTGPIPHGKQFDTFQNSSFEGNACLCGKPLSKECGNLQDSPPSSSKVEDEKGSPLEFGWKPVVIGCGCGLVIGILAGHFVIERRYDWFVHTFGIRLPK